MPPKLERRLLQAATALASTVPLSMGAHSVIGSASVLRGVAPPLPTDLDSHFRYLSGLLLGIGVVFLAAIPRIEKNGTIFRALGLVILIGGLSRLLSLVEAGPPGAGHQFGLVMELAVVPLLVAWQARVARRCATIA
ncbi:MAG: DUF4345 domain-containing protein [Pseudomonadota bacterium]|nr:DUF4345 domain-containing protein [Pseudomonadota bacterium]